MTRWICLSAWIAADTMSAMHARLLSLVIGVQAAAFFTSCKSNDDGPMIRVAAASDLAGAFPEVGAAFTEKTGIRVVFSFGSTGLLAQQIAEGAPFDVFAAANRSFVEDVVRAGICSAGSQETYAIGRIAIWSKDQDVSAISIADLTDPRYTKIAIANPAHAPYGQAALAALVRAGLHEAVKTKLVFGENIQQALQFAQTGNADLAIVALSLASRTDGGHYSVIDDSLHPPLEQQLVVCGKDGGSKAGRAFAAFVTSSEGHAIMRRFGFLLPGDSLASR
jgi:molybdate transport system substrate-binding protein